MIHLSRMIRIYGTWTGSTLSQCGAPGPLTGQPTKVTCDDCREYLSERGNERLHPEQAERRRLTKGGTDVSE